MEYQQYPYPPHKLMEFLRLFREEYPDAVLVDPPEDRKNCVALSVAGVFALIDTHHSSDPAVLAEDSIQQLKSYQKHGC